MSLSKTSIIQLIVVTLIVGGYFFIDFNKVISAIQGKGEFIVQDQNCDLHKQPCEITLKDGTKYTLDIYPRNIPLMKKLKFKVTSSNANEQDLKLRIYATNMMMGEFLFDLEKQPDGSFQTLGTLPTCPIGDMKWNADVEKSSFTKKIGARFQFETDI